MFKRLGRAWRAARSAWASDTTDADTGPKRIDPDLAARALARIIIAQTYRLALEPGDTFPHHVLFMRRYQVVPLDYAARCARCEPALLLEQAQASVSLELLEKGVMPGEGWTLPSMAEGLRAITTLDGWHGDDARRAKPA